MTTFLVLLLIGIIACVTVILWCFGGSLRTDDKKEGYRPILPVIRSYKTKIIEDDKTSGGSKEVRKMSNSFCNLDDPYHRLFRIFHSNGEEWTNNELQDYVRDYGYYIMDFYKFAIDQHGRVYIIDKCGEAEEVYEKLEDFKVEFNLNEIHDKN